MAKRASRRSASTRCENRRYCARVRSRHALHGQQAVLPGALEEQALLRAVAEVALVVLPAARHAPAQAEFLQQVLHLVRIVARHRQVVGAERAGDAAHLAAAAVAAGLVFEFEQHEVLDAGQPQGARGRQAGDAAAGDEDARAARG